MVANGEGRSLGSTRLPAYATHHRAIRSTGPTMNCTPRRSRLRPRAEKISEGMKLAVVDIGPFIRGVLDPSAQVGSNARASGCDDTRRATPAIGTIDFRQEGGLA